MSIFNKIFIILAIPIVTLLIIVSGGLHGEKSLILNDFYRDLKKNLIS